MFAETFSFNSRRGCLIAIFSPFLPKFHNLPASPSLSLIFAFPLPFPSILRLKRRAAQWFLVRTSLPYIGACHRQHTYEKALANNEFRSVNTTFLSSSLIRLITPKWSHNIWPSLHSSTPHVWAKKKKKKKTPFGSQLQLWRAVSAFGHRQQSASVNHWRVYHWTSVLSIRAHGCKLSKITTLACAVTMTTSNPNTRAKL